MSNPIIGIVLQECQNEALRGMGKTTFINRAMATVGEAVDEITFDPAQMGQIVFSELALSCKHANRFQKKCDRK